MARYVCEPMSLKQIDDYFKLGTDVRVKVIPASTLQGKPFDPTTGKGVDVVEKKVVVPTYRRRERDDAAQREYAEDVRRLEEQELGGRLESFSLHDLDRSEIDSTLTGFTQLEDVRNHQENASAAVYESYFTAQYKYDQTLPTYKCREQILRTVDSNQAVVIQGMTGCGKTTQVAQYIIDDYARQRRHCNIVITQPRRIAAISVARRVCEERRWPLGTVCGYQVGLDRKMSQDTRILYCTTGVLLQKFIASKDMTSFTHVIIDEVHERDRDTDFLLLLVRKLLHTTSPAVKVLLMSATIESVKFADYFGYVTKKGFDPAPVLSVQGTMYDVTEFYIEQLAELGKVPEFRMEEPRVSEEASHLCLQLVRHFDEYEKQLWQLSAGPGQLVNKVRGSVLIFLPGMAEIQDVMSHFQELRQSHQLMLVPLHSMLTVDEQHMVFEVPLPQFRKVIFATNIAESSITVPDIAYVVDFCLTKVQVSDPNSNYCSLQLQWASKANCVQRKGRAGRVAKGRVYRLVTEAFYRRLPEESTPEIQRCPLEQAVLHTKLLDIGEPRLVLGLAMDPPNVDDIERSILLLKEVGALLLTTPGVAEYNPYDGELTEAGRIIASLPVDVHVGKLILLGHVFGLLYETIVMAAALSLRSIFARPYKSDLESFKYKIMWSGNSLSDCFACLKAYTTWEKCRFRNAGAEREWGRKNFVQIRRLREMADLVRELKDRLVKKDIHCPDNLRQLTDEEEMILKVILAGAFYPNYFLQSAIDEEAANKEMAGYNRFNTVIVKGLPNQQGAFYRSSIQNLFKVCLPPRVPQVAFESTRAYIQFEEATSLQQQTTKTNPAVYVALKMKSLRDVPLLVNMSEAAGEDLSGSTQFSSLTPRQVDLPAAGNAAVPIFVSEVIHCGHCWAQYHDEDKKRQLKELNVTLTQAVHSGRLMALCHASALPGTYCLAPFSDQNSGVAYYRARIDRFYGSDAGDDASLNSSTATHALVFFVDYGNSDNIAVAELFAMDRTHFALPFQAFEVKLRGVIPCPIRCPGGRWTETAKRDFTTMVFDKETIVAKVFSIVHGIVRVDLYEKVSELHINRELVRLSYAVFAEESLESRQNNMERERSLFSTRSSNSTATRMLSDVVNQIDTSGSRNPYRVKLTGPWHPYEVKFHSVTQTGRMRSVTVMRDSVNCVAIHDEQMQVNRLLVAAHVSQNSSNNGFTIQDTTLLPATPGLPALMALLFAQQAELRVDEHARRFTGVLCGLGWNPDTYNGAFPDHDMELTFDTHIDQEDILLVNFVRHTINQNLSAEIIKMGAAERLQQHARDRLLKLLQKKRPLVEQIYNHRLYQWNLLDPALVMRVEHSDMDSAHALLPLHHSVKIAEDVAQQQTDMPVSQLEEKRRHVAWLHEIAARTAAEGFLQDVNCQLCRQRMLAPRGLALHLATMAHRQAEAALLVRQQPLP